MRSKQLTGGIQDASYRHMMMETSAGKNTHLE